jgi:hypothetical protein
VGTRRFAHLRTSERPSQSLSLEGFLFKTADKTTSEYIGAMIGTRTEIIKSESAGDTSRAHGHAYQPVGVPLYRPNDLIGRCLHMTIGPTRPRPRRQLTELDRT